MATCQRKPLKTENAWKNLQEYYDQKGSGLNMLDMFNSDPKRFDNFRLVVCKHWIIGT